MPSSSMRHRRCLFLLVIQMAVSCVFLPQLRIAKLGQHMLHQFHLAAWLENKNNTWAARWIFEFHSFCPSCMDSFLFGQRWRWCLGMILVSVFSGFWWQFPTPPKTRQAMYTQNHKIRNKKVEVQVTALDRLMLDVFVFLIYFLSTYQLLQNTHSLHQFASSPDGIVEIFRAQAMFVQLHGVEDILCRKLRWVASWTWGWFLSFGAGIRSRWNPMIVLWYVVSSSTLIPVITHFWEFRWIFNRDPFLPFRRSKGHKLTSHPVWWDQTWWKMLLVIYETCPWSLLLVHEV